MLTNEEKRVRIYSRNERPTTPSEVTPNTPLEDLNLNWRERDLPERERTKHVHRLHPYLGKFIPQLVEIFLRKYFRPGQIVLDPFCGSGTTLVQANELGIESVGYDISAFNVLLVRAKTAKYDVRELSREVYDILQKVKLATRPEYRQGTLWTADIPKVDLPQTEEEYLTEWFAPQALRDLLTYRALIDSENYEYKDLLKVILSRSARSARLTTHYDLDFPKKPQREPYWCYKHSRTCQPTEEAFKFLRRYSIDSIERIAEFVRKRSNTAVTVHHADSRTAELPRIDGVITSPPYVGLIDYHKQHAYAYSLLGLEDKSSLEIGAASNGSGLNARLQYQKDISDVFRRIKEVLSRKSPIIVVANDKANLYDQIANDAELEVEAVVQRHVNRRTGRRSGEFYESVFIWRKP